jgi:predicted alpha/beta-fold hydrolase
LGSRGVRVFRLDLRGCGAGLRLARLPYHSGRSEDAAAAIELIEKLSPGSPLTLIGYSLGGNITLKLIGELGERPCGGLDSGIAVCPPIDLAKCAQRIGTRANFLYDRHFVRMLQRSVAVKRRLRPDVPPMPSGRRPCTLREFDELYTAPVSGFGTAENYYRLASSRCRIEEIRRSTLIIAADDDPMIPVELFHDLPRSEHLQVHVAHGGGHLGFIAGNKSGTDGDRRWLDWRILDWVLALESPAPDGAPIPSSTQATS